VTEYYKEGDCTICEKWFPLLHWHHTIPQSMGGKNSLQIPLCAQCHNLLHAHALAVVAKVKKTRAGLDPKKQRQYWANQTMEHNAGPYLKILVEATLNDESVVGKQYVMQFKAPPALHTALQLYKSDSNVSSLEKAMVLAISEFLRDRGYLDNERSIRDQGTGNKGSARGKPNLW
jgi:hypothetical protein